MITRYLVVNNRNDAMGAVTQAPPSSTYLESLNSPNLGPHILQGQPYRVVKLVEDTTFTFSEK